MTLAVLHASAGTALEPLDATRLGRDLDAALRAAGAHEVEWLDSAADPRLRETARRAHDANERLLICADNLVAHPGLLWTLATEPAGRTTVLVIADPAGDLRDDRGLVTAAAAGAGSVRYLGAICLAPADLPLLAKVAGRSDLLPALLEAGLVPVATRVRQLHAEQVRTESELVQARGAVAAIDEETVRLRLAVKEHDDFFTTYAVSSWSPLVTRAAARLGLSPTAVTWISVLVVAGAALGFWQASRPAMIAGGILLYLGFVLDCVDGQLARFTRRFDAFGGWLDTMADRGKEYLVYAGLAAGADRIGLPYAWPLAITAIVLQTVRHMTDTWYGVLHDEAVARPRVPVAGGVGARLSAASARVQGRTGSAAYWLKRIVVLPIGERWALLAVVAMLADGRAALAALVGWGVLAFGYTLALRSLRSLSMRVSVLDKADTGRHRDDGPLVRSLLSRAMLPAPLAFAGLAAVASPAAVWFAPARLAVPVAALVVLAAGLPARAKHDGPLDWLVPAALRAAEYLFVVAAGWAGGVPPPVIFLLLFALALRHYDLTARLEKGDPAGRGAALIGWDGRVLLLAVATTAGLATAGAAAPAAGCLAFFGVNAIIDWRTGGVRP